MAKMPKEVMDLFNDPQASRALATVDSAGNLNVVPKGSLIAINEETLAYGDIFGGKTKQNLDDTCKAAATVFKMAMPPVGYQVKGTCQGYQTSGPLFDLFAKEVKERIKMDIKAVGMIKVEEVYSVAPPNVGEKIA